MSVAAGKRRGAGAAESATQGSTPPLARVRKVQKKGVERRQAILDVARSVLIDGGVAGLVLRDVADKVGITHGNLQYYFATKDDLIVAIFDQEVQRYTNAMHEAVGRTSTRQGRISAIVDAAVSEIRGASTALWLTMIVLSRQNPALRKVIADSNGRYEASLADELNEIAPELSLRRRSHLAQMIRMMLDGLSMQAGYSDLDGPEMIALQGEMKAAISAWFEVG